MPRLSLFDVKSTNWSSLVPPPHPRRVIECVSVDQRGEDRHHHHHPHDSAAAGRARGQVRGMLGNECQGGKKVSQICKSTRITPLCFCFRNNTKPKQESYEFKAPPGPPPQPPTQVSAQVRGGVSGHTPVTHLSCCSSSVPSLVHPTDEL